MLIKLDIAKAFDSVRWDYLLDLMQRMGFPSRWRAWASLILSTTTSRVLLNGIPGKEIIHGRGLRQGDPLSPLLFDLAIDTLPKILELATESGLLHPLPGHFFKSRISLYADDAVIFLQPSAHDVNNLAALLHNFGEVTGLMTNVEKSSVTPIRCADIDLNGILTNFPAALSQFPIKYLGLPLSLGRLRRIDLQPYIDKVASRLNPWKSKFLNRAGCEALVKSVLTALPVFLLTVIRVDKAILKAFDKLRRSMLWAASDKVSGGKCKVGWTKVCRPKKLGGLGILDLEKFSRALRLRWLWLEWDAPDKPWVGLETPNNAADKELFNAATEVTIGDGMTAHFWTSSWLNGMAPMSIAPKIFEASKKKNRRVQNALTNLNWVADISVQNFTVEHITEFVNLWGCLQEVTLTPGTVDTITWTFSPNGRYSAGSAYKSQFLGSIPCAFGDLVWKTWAPPKCRFFSWLVVQNRLWTSH